MTGSAHILSTELDGHAGLQGLNHITLATADLDRSFHFYVNVLGFKPHVRWARGAYLSCRSLWLCLSVDAAAPAADYTHIAFTMEEGSLERWSQHLNTADVQQWKNNTSEGDSIYFLDPDGHKLELHSGSLESRLAGLIDSPYDQLEWFA